MWTEDGLQLAADDFSWALTGELAREPSFKTERDNLLFEMNVSPFSNGSASFEEDSLKFDFNDE